MTTGRDARDAAESDSESIDVADRDGRASVASAVWSGDDSLSVTLPTTRVAQLVPLIVDDRDDPA